MTLLPSGENAASTPATTRRREIQPVRMTVTASRRCNSTARAGVTRQGCRGAGFELARITGGMYQRRAAARSHQFRAAPRTRLQYPTAVPRKRIRRKRANQSRRARSPLAQDAGTAEPEGPQAGQTAADSSSATRAFPQPQGGERMRSGNPRSVPHQEPPGAVRIRRPRFDGVTALRLDAVTALRRASGRRPGAGARRGCRRFQPRSGVHRAARASGRDAGRGRCSACCRASADRAVPRS